MSNKGLDNYVEVGPRKAAFRKDHPKGSIETGFTFVTEGESSGLVIQATIRSGDRQILGSAQSLLQDLSEEKGFEKVESTAVGRALDHAGYPSDQRYTADYEQNEVESAVTKAPTPTKVNPFAVRSTATPVKPSPVPVARPNPLAARAAAPKPTPAPTAAPAPRRLGGLSSKLVTAAAPPLDAEYEVDEAVESSDDSFDAEQEA